MKYFLICAFGFVSLAVEGVRAQGAFVDLAGRGDGSKRQDTTRQDTEAAFKAASKGNPGPLLALTNLEGRVPEPKDALYLTWRAFALILLGRDAEAVRLAQQAERLVAPELKGFRSTQPMREIVNVYCYSGRGADALRYMRALVAAFPREDELANSLAWMLATHPDPKLRNGPEAMRLALLANKASGFRDAFTADTYAAAAAECGKFEEAAAKQRDAVARGNRDSDWNAVSRAQAMSRLRLYESRKPYRDPAGRDGLILALRKRES